MKIINKQEIEKLLIDLDLIKLIEEGFVEYSNGNVIVPPVGELSFDNPPGECHIKYGYIKNDDYYVIKIAQGFYDNPKLGLPSNSGLNIIFSQLTGEILCILLDEGYLTDIRTAVAGAIAAKYMAPASVKGIGIVGTGIQAKLQLQYLQGVIDCSKVIVWGRSQSSIDKFKIDVDSFGFDVQTTLDMNILTEKSNLIVTCTPSKIPLIKADQIKQGTHITTIGSDTTEKQELDEKIIDLCDKIVVDSISQSQSRGEVFHYLKAGYKSKTEIIELGKIIDNPKLGRISDTEITIVDLTGVAVQDIQISKAIYLKL
ncbi:MAG: ornithine cyclodeaminase family protein [Candidatus Heimdallarchaeota archaeon]|nr:ornithine cyclodeaminase family protein [Candidatus Heimdallarchaeota archaeon]